MAQQNLSAKLRLPPNNPNLFDMRPGVLLSGAI